MIDLGGGSLQEIGTHISQVLWDAFIIFHVR